MLMTLTAAADDRIEVEVDPRVELVSIVCRLAGLTEYNQAPDSPWLQAVDAQFGPHKDHPAVKETKKLKKKYGIAYDAPISLALHLDRDTWRPRVPLTPLPRRLDDRWDAKTAERYAEHLRQFASDSHFDDFLDRQAEDLDVIEARYRRWMAKHEVIDWFDELFGPAQEATYTVHPGLIAGPNNYGTAVLLPDGSLEIRPVLGVGVVDERGLPDISNDRPMVLVHEVAHAYINPLFARHEDRVAEGGQAVFRKVASQMKATAYTTWQTVANESGVRATAVLYAKDHYGEEAIGTAAAGEIAAGFSWILPMTAALDGYRTQNSTGLEGFPAVAGKVLSEWAISEPAPPYLGPINAFGGDKNTVMILPNTTDEPASMGAQMYAMSMHEKFWADEKVDLISADDADNAAEKRRIYYGTPSTSPPLADLLSRLNWSVGDDGISFGTRRFSGEGLALIATFVDPDGSVPVQIYTAATSAGVEGLNGVLHGPTDWVIALRDADGAYQVHAEGNFPKNFDGRWSNPAEVMDLNFDRPPPPSPQEE